MLQNFKFKDYLILKIVYDNEKEADLGLLQHLRWSTNQPLTIITKCSILDVVAVLDPPLMKYNTRFQVNIIKFSAKF